VNPVTSAGAEIQQFCTGQGWSFCFIGGLAVQRWGEPRATVDADLTVITGFGTEATFVDAILAAFTARIPDAREFALQRRVVLAQAANGVGLDISLGALPYEGRVVDRASNYMFAEGPVLTICGAEDLIVLKSFAGRERDWLDVEGVVVRQAGKLDEELIWSELVPLLELKEAPEDADRLRSILAAAA
jgi:hypothetical protein